MGKKYILEVSDEPDDYEEGRKYYRCVDAPWWSISETILNRMTPYEPKPEPEPAFNPGDEVEIIDDDNLKAVILDQSEESGMWHILDENGCVDGLSGRILRKTGRQYPEVTKLIERLRQC